MIEMPYRIARLPRDRRGYPIPWNVFRGVDDAPIFTVNDSPKSLEAVRRELCPICGERLGTWKWFVGGIRSAFHPRGAYADLPGHHDCERFALATCPYLSLPNYLGRIDIPDPSKIPAGGAGFVDHTMIEERPEVFVAVASDKMEVVNLLEGSLTPVVVPKKPHLAYEFWFHGKQIGEAEAMPAMRRVMGEEWTVPALRT
jgi:hypothetical protein